METYDQICLKLTQTTCKKKTHHIVIKALDKYGDNVSILNKKENNKWHKKSQLS